MLQVGIARCSITPAMGMTMPGYAARELPAIEKDGELYATALVLDDGESRAAILAFDLVFILEPLASDLRKAVGEKIASPASHVLLNCSHTHCAPAIDQFQYDDDPDQENLRSLYNARLRAEVPALVEMAAHRLRPARMATAAGEATIGINRRELLPDGTIVLGENPTGVVDHQVRVIRFDDLDGKPLAVLFAHGCHTVTMGPKYLGYSADYIGPARDLVEQNLGCLSLYLQTNAGDINPITGIGDKEDNTNEKTRLGTMLGAEVLKVQAPIYTESVRGERTFIGSLSKIPKYPRVPLSQEPNCKIRVEEKTVALPFQPLPSLSEAEDILAASESEVNSLQGSGRVVELNVARAYRHWALVLVEHVKNNRGSDVKIPLQALSIGDQFAIVAIPAETFCSTGLDIKAQSPFENTLVAGYSNGCISYIPTADAYPREGWSIRERYAVPDLIFQGYLLPTALRSDCSDILIEASLKLLAKLKSAVSKTPPA